MKAAVRLACASVISTALTILAGCGGSSSGPAIPAQVKFQTPAPGSQLTYAVQAVEDGAAASFTFAKTFNTVNSDGSMTTTLTCSSSGTGYCSSYTDTEDSTGHILSQTFLGGGGCSFSQWGGEGLPFPLYIGQTWSASWAGGCSSGLYELYGGYPGFYDG
jgi:hypothetical protein